MSRFIIYSKIFMMYILIQWMTQGHIQYLVSLNVRSSLHMSARHVVFISASPKTGR